MAPVTRRKRRQQQSVSTTTSEGATATAKEKPEKAESEAGASLPIKKDPFLIWELPDVLLYHIATFCVPQGERVTFLCHQVAPLCKAASKAILEESKSVGLWDIVLSGDYGVVSDDIDSNNTATNEDEGKTGHDQENINQMKRRQHQSRSRQRRRSCKRLRRYPIDQVKDAHKLLRDNTELAYYYLWELSYTSAANSLTKSKLCGILNEYGPNLMLNKTVSSGGTFLVEVCRARSTTQHTILNCVRELIERRGALVNFPTNESANATITALCVAAVRGMPKVVRYLLSRGASPTIRCSARFRLYTNPKKSLRCTNSTPLEFSKAMIEAEREEGATTHDTRNLSLCVKLLTETGESPPSSSSS